MATVFQCVTAFPRALRPRERSRRPRRGRERQSASATPASAAIRESRRTSVRASASLSKWAIMSSISLYNECDTYGASATATRLHRLQSAWAFGRAGITQNRFVRARRTSKCHRRPAPRSTPRHVSLVALPTALLDIVWHLRRAGIRRTPGPVTVRFRSDSCRDRGRGGGPAGARERRARLTSSARSTRSRRATS